MPIATVSPQLKARRRASGSPPSTATCSSRRTMTRGSPRPAQDSLVVVIHTDGGVSGVGECDANPWMAKACINAPGTHTMGLSIKDMLIGADPFEIGDLWRRDLSGHRHEWRAAAW